MNYKTMDNFTGHHGSASATEDRGSASTSEYRGSASESGDCGSALATGKRGTASETGKSFAAMACGIEGKAMGEIGCAIFLVEIGDWNGETYPILHAKAVIVDGEKIKPNVWYTLKNGEIIEAD